MSFNLLRNARVFFTTNVNATTGVVAASGFTTGNTREIQVLDGLSFSQATTTETVTLSEAGDSPVRGQRQFNTALDPVEFSMSTYIRPYYDTAAGRITAITATLNGTTLGDGTNSTAVGTQFGPLTQIIVQAPASGKQATLTPIFNASNQLIGVGIVDGGSGYSTGALSITVVDPDNPAETQTLAISASTVTSGGAGIVTAEEGVLWNAMFGTSVIGGATPAWSEASGLATVSLANSNKNQLQKFGLIIVMDGSSYIIDNCVLNTATIDFGLDAIATIAWAGNGSRLRSITATASQADPVVLASTAGDITGQAKAKTTAAPFLANKLSTITVNSEFSNGTNYTLALTGGSIAINNNITYLTPANLGIVNQPITYFTGTRSITGTLTCYLRTGANNSAGLLADMLSSSTSDVSPNHRVTISIGGAGSVRTELEMPAAVFSIPSINTEQVVSTEIAFSAHATNDANTALDLTKTNELTVKYYSNI